MWGSKLVAPVVIVVVAAVLVGAMLPPLGRYYVQNTAITLGMAILIVNHWRDLENRWAWVVGATLASVMLFLDHPQF